MAFNLNKSDESISKIDSSQKSNSASKFDLSKNDDPILKNEKEYKNSKTWPFAILGVLLLGGGAWYSFSNTSDDIIKDASSTSVVESNDSSKSSNGQSEASEVNTNDIVPESISENSNSLEVSESQNKTVANSTSSSSNNESTVKRANTTSNVSETNLNNKVSASFGKASTSFSSIDNSLVKDIVTFLEKNPNATIAVNGYASSEGILAANQQISQSRANTFKRHLISQGISKNRITANGYGIDNPIASNDTEAGREKNRRVEISIH
ncbi:OmpA family protein [Flavobacterium sp. K5-23]|uniref:OmpA family protein n=1 Tax=Flavobacterium sp. K5-23 TaxID=2746225 RepID=UPI00200F9CAC|nr:OmpA family protein [Flavobacterium sp. K5-23]UQD57231.1 OmpA family protein [Flavobacterium sp. K5-23]